MDQDRTSDQNEINFFISYILIRRPGLNPQWDGWKANCEALLSLTLGIIAPYIISMRLLIWTVHLTVREWGRAWESRIKPDLMPSATPRAAKRTISSDLCLRKEEKERFLQEAVVDWSLPSFFAKVGDLVLLFLAAWWLVFLR